MIKHMKPRIIDGTRELTNEDMIDIIKKEEYCVISTVGEDNVPYGFPMSYIYKDEHIYFHCALDGHKIDNFKNNKNVCLTFVGNTKLIEEDLDTAYESVIVFGEVEEVIGDKKVEILIDIVKKYAPNFLEKGIEEANRDSNITAIYKVSIEKMTGKIRRY